MSSLRLAMMLSLAEAGTQPPNKNKNKNSAPSSDTKRRKNNNNHNSIDHDNDTMQHQDYHDTHQNQHRNRHQNDTRPHDNDHQDRPRRRKKKKKDKKRKRPIDLIDEGDDDNHDHHTQTNQQFTIHHKQTKTKPSNASSSPQPRDASTNAFITDNYTNTAKRKKSKKRGRKRKRIMETQSGELTSTLAPQLQPQLSQDGNDHENQQSQISQQQQKQQQQQLDSPTPATTSTISMEQEEHENDGDSSGNYTDTDVFDDEESILSTDSNSTIPPQSYNSDSENSSSSSGGSKDEGHNMHNPHHQRLHSRKYARSHARKYSHNHGIHGSNENKDEENMDGVFDQEMSSADESDAQNKGSSTLAKVTPLPTPSSSNLPLTVLSSTTRHKHSKLSKMKRQKKRRSKDKSMKKKKKKNSQNESHHSPFLKKPITALMTSPTAESSNNVQTNSGNNDHSNSNKHFQGNDDGDNEHEDDSSSCSSSGSGSSTSSGSQQRTVKDPSKSVIQWVLGMSQGKQRRKIAEGMRVKVRFEIKSKKRGKDGTPIRKYNWYGGAVSKVGKEGKKIRIKYDDGTSEVTHFPDKEIVVDAVGNGEHSVPADAFLPQMPPTIPLVISRTSTASGDTGSGGENSNSNDLVKKTATRRDNAVNHENDTSIPQQKRNDVVTSEKEDSIQLTAPAISVSSTTTTAETVNNHEHDTTPHKNEVPPPSKKEDKSQLPTVGISTIKKATTNNIGNEKDTDNLPSTSPRREEIQSLSTDASDSETTLQPKDSGISSNAEEAPPSLPPAKVVNNESIQTAKENKICVEISKTSPSKLEVVSPSVPSTSSQDKVMGLHSNNINLNVSDSKVTVTPKEEELTSAPVAPASVAKRNISNDDHTMKSSITKEKSTSRSEGTTIRIKIPAKDRDNSSTNQKAKEDVSGLSSPSLRQTGAVPIMPTRSIDEGSSGEEINSKHRTNRKGKQKGKPKRKGKGKSRGRLKSSTEEAEKWVKCDRCDKWRCLPSHIDTSKLPEHWYCELNVYDKKRNTCDAPEQTSEEVMKERKAKKMEHAMNVRSESTNRLKTRSPLTVEKGTPSEFKKRTGDGKVSNFEKTRSPRCSPVPDNKLIGNHTDRSVLNEILEEQRSGEEGTSGPDNDGGGSDNTTASALPTQKSGKGSSRRNRRNKDDEKEKKGKKGEKQKESDNQEWVQCDTCEKWRRLPPHVRSEDLPEKWTCDMNDWDIRSASCAVQEDSHTQGILGAGGQSINSSSNKLSYRNLIRVPTRPVTERMRAEHSLFSSLVADPDAPPTCLYANSSAFQQKQRNEREETFSLFQYMKKTQFWKDLLFEDTKPGLNNFVDIQNFDIGDAQVTFSNKCSRSMKAMVHHALGTKVMAAHEVLFECQCNEWDDIQLMELRANCTFQSITHTLNELVNDGIVEVVPNPNADDFDNETLKYRRTKIENDQHIRRSRPMKKRFGR